MELVKPQTPRNTRRTEGDPSPARRRNSEPVAQTTFDFGPVEGARTLPTSAMATVYCNAPVAFAPPRMTAAVIDLLVPLAGFATFATAFHLTAGESPAQGEMPPYYAAAAVLILVFYRIFCCVAGIDTPGLQLAGLRLLNVDGRVPGRRARFLRLAGGVVSLLPAGLGLLWSLFDEERLAWHDHISGTFPTRR